MPAGGPLESDPGGASSLAWRRSGGVRCFRRPAAHMTRLRLDPAVLLVEHFLVARLAAAFLSIGSKPLRLIALRERARA